MMWHMLRMFCETILSLRLFAFFGILFPPLFVGSFLVMNGRIHYLVRQHSVRCFKFSESHLWLKMNLGMSLLTDERRVFLMS